MLPGVSPRGIDPHGKSKGSFLETLAGYAILLLGFCIIIFLRWWALVIGQAIYCAVIFFRKRKLIHAAFSPSENPALTAKDRLLILRNFAILAVYVTVLAILFEPNVYACFATSLLWLVTFYLYKVKMEAAESTKRLVYYLTTAGLELAAIATVTLAAYSIFSWRVSLLTSDSVTLDRVRFWEEAVTKVHEFFESANPSKLLTMILIAGLYAGRVIEIRYSRGSGVVSRVWQGAQFYFKWVDRLALATLIASSFTFLATGYSGPAGPLEAHLKEMEANYTQLRGETEKALTVEIKRLLFERVWNEMPPVLRENLLRDQDLQKEKLVLLEKMEWANAKYNLAGTQSATKKEEFDAEFGKSDATVLAFPDAPLLPEFNEIAGDADFATAADLRDAASTASSARSEVMNEAVEKGEMSEMGEETFKSVQSFVLDTDRLTDNIGFLKVLTGNYPLLGEVLDRVNDAFNDYVFDKMKPKIEQLVQQVLKDPKKSVVAEIKRESVELTRNLQIHWPTDDQLWHSELDQKLSAEKSGIAGAERQLEADARFAEGRKTKEIIDEIGQREQEYQKIGEAMPRHKDLLQEKTEIEAKLKTIAHMAPEADPLAGYNNSASAKATELKAPLDRSKALERALQIMIHSSESTPLDQLSNLNDQSASRIRTLIGQSSSMDRMMLSHVLGSEPFVKYELEYELQESGRDIKLAPDILNRARSSGELDPAMRQFERGRVEPRVEPHIEPHIDVVP